MKKTNLKPEINMIVIIIKYNSEKISLPMDLINSELKKINNDKNFLKNLNFSPNSQ